MNSTRNAWSQSGPYRYVRNPLYLGMWLLTLALAILMPPGGALFVVAAVTILIIVLVRAEEHKLTVERGEVYAAYVRQVPRFSRHFLPEFPQMHSSHTGSRGF